MSSRKYPLSKPPDHTPPVPRWTLEFEGDAPLHTAYIGVQRHDGARSTETDTDKEQETEVAFQNAIQKIETRPDNMEGERQFEKFTHLSGDDIPGSIIWAVYFSFSNETDYKAALESLDLDLVSIYTHLQNKSIGLWKETFRAPPSRLETNYSGTDYLPGLARLPGSEVKEHSLTAYWGAARDRIADSEHDKFEFEALLDLYRLFGTNTFDNIVHIRSGQFWGNCSEAESQAYENDLEPALMNGLRYVWENREESGALGVRFLRNLPTGSTKPSSNPGAVLKETCAAGFFANLSDLERWAKRHPSHLAIFNGAMRHARVFGPEKKFRTWHEVSVLKRGRCALSM